MITIYIDYKGPRSIETERFSDFDARYLKKLAEIEQDKLIIDGVKVFRSISKQSENIVKSFKHQLLISTTNPGVAIRKARALANR